LCSLLLLPFFFRDLYIGFCSKALLSRPPHSGFFFCRSPRKDCGIKPSPGLFFAPFGAPFPNKPGMYRSSSYSVWAEVPLVEGTHLAFIGFLFISQGGHSGCSESLLVPPLHLREEPAFPSFLQTRCDLFVPFPCRRSPRFTPL